MALHKHCERKKDMPHFSVNEMLVGVSLERMNDHSSKNLTRKEKDLTQVSR